MLLKAMFWALATVIGFYIFGVGVFKVLDIISHYIGPNGAVFIFLFTVFTFIYYSNLNGKPISTENKES